LDPAKRDQEIRGSACRQASHLDFAFWNSRHLGVGSYRVAGTWVWPLGAPRGEFLVGLGIVGIAYLLFFNWRVVPSPNYRPVYGWINALLVAALVGLLAETVPPALDLYVGVLLILSVISSAVLSERPPAYVLIGLVTLFVLLSHRERPSSLQEWTLGLSLLLMAAIIVETVKQLKICRANRIRQLETITEFGRRSVPRWMPGRSWRCSMPPSRTRRGRHLLRRNTRKRRDASISFTTTANTSGISRVKLEFPLFVGVIHHESLFLPDLEGSLTSGVRTRPAGQAQTSLSWLGVPMQTGYRRDHCRRFLPSQCVRSPT
jgi:hypothetical protein